MAAASITACTFFTAPPGWTLQFVHWSRHAEVPASPTLSLPVGLRRSVAHDPTPCHWTLVQFGRFILFRSVQLSLPSPPDSLAPARSLHHLIRPLQQRLRDRQAEGSGGPQVDHQLELRSLLNRQVSRLGD